MKYNPTINEEIAALPGFTNIHPLQPISTVQGALELIMVLQMFYQIYQVLLTLL